MCIIERLIDRFSDVRPPPLSSSTQQLLITFLHAETFGERQEFMSERMRTHYAEADNGEYIISFHLAILVF